MAEWFENISAADSVVKSLFKAEASEALKNLEEEVAVGLGTKSEAEAFMKARDAAMKALYSEVI